MYGIPARIWSSEWFSSTNTSSLVTGGTARAAVAGDCAVAGAVAGAAATAVHASSGRSASRARDSGRMSPVSAAGRGLSAERAHRESSAHAWPLAHTIPGVGSDVAQDRGLQSLGQALHGRVDRGLREPGRHLRALVGLEE